eukprot:10804782-Heterocapsa_arctica.AAC.1
MHGRAQSNAPVLQLSLAVALEVIDVAVLADAHLVPEADRGLHAQLALKGNAREHYLRTIGAE